MKTEFSILSVATDWFTGIFYESPVYFAWHKRQQKITIMLLIIMVVIDSQLL